MTELIDTTTISIGAPAAGRPAGDTSSGHAADDDRLTQNATALVVSGLLTSVLGFGFWVVAARVLSTDDVGTGTALVAAVVLLANMSSLGLRNAFPRFIPVAGSSTRRLVGRGYAVCAAVAVALGVGFILGSSLWADHLAMLRSSPLGGLGFVVATAGWTIFILQDSVLTGLRRAGWVPVENLVYAVAKIVLLVLVVSTGRWALMLAWALPAIAVLAPLNALIFRRLIPAHHAAADAAGHGIGHGIDTVDARFDWRALARFAAGEHAADVVKNFGAEGVVLVVLATVGPAESAALFFAIVISASLQLVTSNIVNAFVAEAAARPFAVDELLRRAALHAARLVVPAALLGAVFAPVALSVFGSAYEQDGTAVLRLLLLALIPQILVSLAIGLARFERRVGLIFAIAIGTSIAPLCGALVFATRFGVVAVGWSVLVGQLVLALVLGGVVFRGPVIEAIPAALVSRAVATRTWLRHRRRIRAVGSILDELDAVHRTGEPLHPRRVLRNTTDVVVVAIDHPTNPRVIKIALSRTAEYGLLDHAQAVRALRTAAATTFDGAAALPSILEAGTVVGHAYLIESRCPGFAPLVADHGTLRAAAEALSSVHRLTAETSTVGDALAVALVDDPIDVLATDQRLAQYRPALDALRVRLSTALRGRRLVTARTHGDFWLGNLLVQSSVDGVVVTGIIDWEDSQATGLPDVDLAHLWLTTEADGIASAAIRALGVESLDSLTGPWVGSVPNPSLDAETVVLLAWLAHVASGIDRASKFALGRVWLQTTVRPVLDALTQPVEVR